MPCNFCDNLLTSEYLPCKLNDIKTQKIKYNFSNHTCNIILALKRGCPCKNCIVNSVCTMNTRCEYYENFVENANRDEEK